MSTNINDLIRQFTADVILLESEKKAIDQAIKEKKLFLKSINKRIQPKYSEMWQSLENDDTIFWKIEEIKVESRINSFIKITIHKKWFFNNEQLKIIERFYSEKYNKPITDIRIIHI